MTVINSNVAETLNISENGTYDVSNYTGAVVNTPVAPDAYIRKVKSGTRILNSSSPLDLTGIDTIGDYALAYACYHNTISGFSIPSLSGISTINQYGCNSMCSQCSTLSGTVDLSGLTTVGNYGCQQMFDMCINITSVDLSSLEHLSANNAFYQAFRSCIKITTVDLSSLKDITGESACDTMFRDNKLTSVNLSNLSLINAKNACNYMFYAISSLTSINLSSLEKIKSQSACAYMFGSTGITNITLPSLIVIDGSTACQNMLSVGSSLISADVSSLVAANGNSCMSSMFYGDTGLTNVNLSSLKYVNGTTPCYRMFRSCTALTTLSFPALKTAASASFNSMLQDTTGCTVHFPSNMSSYAFTVGGTDTTVLYDLPATNILTGADTINYERNPKYDTATALAWRVEDTGTAPDFVVDWTPFYTSGLTDPTVGTTIYSDAECTTSVTTVASIS